MHPATAPCDDGVLVDLYWALRGGSGNFGIVTSFEFRLHPVGPIILGGLMLFPLERAREVMWTYRDVVADAPEELATAAVMLHAPPEPFIPEDYHGRLAFAVAISWCGEPAEGEAVVRPLKDAGPVADVVGPMPYRALQAILDETAPAGWRN